MANTLKLRGGTTAEVAAASLAEREIMVDTTKDVIVVGPTKKEMAVGNGGTYTGNYTFSGNVTINGAATFGTSVNANSLRIQNVATPTGNSDAANKSYVDAEITSVVNTTLPGNVFSADGSVTIANNNPGVGDIDLGVTAGSITTAKLADNSVTTAKILDNNVTGSKFANNSIVTGKIADQAVTSAKLAVGAVSSNRIEAGAVATAKIADTAVTAIKIATGAVTLDKIPNGEITLAKLNAGAVVIDSEQSTAAVNDTSVLTTKASDSRYFKQDTSETISSGNAWSGSDNYIATTKAIDARIVDLVDDVGGCVPIANETSFPNANPDINNGTGTLVSVPLANALTSNASGVITISNGTVGNSTVTINGAGASVTFPVGYGLLVETSATLNAYTFHRVVPKATEVTTVAGNITSVNTVAANITIINSVNNNQADIDTVAANNANVTTVANNISDVNDVVTNIAAVQGAANNAASAATSATAAATSATNAATSEANAAASATTASSAATTAAADAVTAINSLSFFGNYGLITDAAGTTKDYGALT